MNTKLLLFAGFTTGLALQLCSTAFAVPITVTDSALVGLTIPDNDLNGLASTIAVNTPFNAVTGVELTLNIVGGFNGDYYAYLQYNSGLVVLLNNLGGSPSNPYGSPGGGFNVTFSDSAANISTAPVTPGAPLTGTWAPQSGSLSTFNGLNPNGDWTLFIADESPGGVGTLENWSLEVTGNGSAAVPDTSSTAGLLALGVSLLALWSRVNRRPDSA